MKTNFENNENNNLDLLIIKLKTEYSTYANLSKAIQIMYLILIPLFILLTLLDYLESQNINTIFKGICLIPAFLIFALFFRKYYKEYKYVDYSLPTIQMLKKAVWRYQLFHKRTVWILLALILIDVGMTFEWINYYNSIMTIQFIFWGIITIAIIIGLIIWHYRYKPIRDEMLLIIKEIEGE